MVKLLKVLDRYPDLPGLIDEIKAAQRQMGGTDGGALRGPKGQSGVPSMVHSGAWNPTHLNIPESKIRPLPLFKKSLDRKRAAASYGNVRIKIPIAGGHRALSRRSFEDV